MRLSFYGVVLSAVAGALVWAGCSAPKPPAAAAPPPVPASVAVATKESLPVEVRAVGAVEASSVVQVKSQIAGELMSVRFTEGTDIKKGDLLFEIDPRPYREALRQAEAAVARDEAQMRQAQANLARDQAQSKYAETDAGRYEALLKEGVVSRTQYDQSKTNSDAMRESVRADSAAIETAKALLDSDRAAVDRAKLDLSYCEIRSPISGRAGNLLVHAGNLVQSNGPNPLVVINQITPIFVSFGVPERYLDAIRRRAAGRKLPVVALPQNASAQNTSPQNASPQNPSDARQSSTGVLTVIDNTVDAATGTIHLKATFDNEHRLLWPGQFVNAVLTLDTQADATMVPSEAVQAGQHGSFVYVVKADQTVEARNVTVGLTVRGKVKIETGVAPGETVVTDGQLRLYPGARIQPVPASKLDSQGS